MLKQGFILEFVNACSKQTLSMASEKVTLILSAVLKYHTCPDRGGITHVDQIVSRGCVVVPWLEVQNHSRISRNLILPILYHELDWCLKYILARL